MKLSIFLLILLEEVLSKNENLQGILFKIIQEGETLCFVNKNDSDIGNLVRSVSLHDLSISIYGFDFITFDVHCTSYILALGVLELGGNIDSLEFSRKFKSNSNILVVINDITHLDFSSIHQISLKQGFNIKVLEVKNQSDGSILQQSNELDFILYSTLEQKIFDTTVCPDDAYLILPSFNWDPLNELKKLNQSFQVVGFSCPPFVTFHDNNLTGLDVELIKLIFRNWPIHFRILNDTINPYNDLKLLLQNRTADMSSCSSWLTIELLIAKYGLSPYYHENCFSFVVHKPSRLPDATFMYQCFRLSLWCFIIFVICFVVVSMTIFQKICTEEKMDIEKIFILISSRLVGNSFKERLTSRSKVLKYILILWCLCSLIIITYYNAGLTSILQYPRVDLQVNSIKDMIKMSIYWLERKNVGIQSFLRTLGGIHDKIADLFIFEKDAATINSQLRTGKFAIRVEVLPGRGLRHHEVLDEYGRTHMKVLPGCFMKHYCVFVLQKNSPYHYFLSRKLLEVISYGFVDILFKKMIDKQHKKIVEGFFTVYIGDENNILSLSKIQGGFWLIMIGWLLAVIYFIYEKYCK
ncbi:hypothetical protein HHI36_014151 [Cryptolaemus montrouzieri]|uniref:Ionotropic glutamate receptor C-terminal domain-containing protein n=1 Tax=Cryptolaemus montrouzieri TaxID=559131 RepID=A0ABD2N2C2_9CUCU